MAEERNYSAPNYKMGIKVLTLKQLESLFTMYPNFRKKVEIYRKNIPKKDYISKGNQYNLIYDNIFSIFGVRGSGKTSILFTLKNELEREKHHINFVFPIIMPEMILEGCSVFGWIFSILKTQIDNLDLKSGTTSIYSEYFKDCSVKRSRVEAFDKLKTQLEKVEKLCFSSGRLELSNYRPIEVTSILAEQALNHYELMESITLLWTYFVDVLKGKLEVEDKNTKKQLEEPLIFLMFDDIDLVPQRTAELLTAINKFLSHPNIICVITADENMFKDAIYQKFYKDLYGDRNYVNVIIENNDNFFAPNISKKFFINNHTRNDRIPLYVKNYMDKLLPPSTRYYLTTYVRCESKKMFIDTIQSENSNKTIWEHIKDNIQDLNNSLKNLKYLKKFKDIENFLLYKEDGKNEEYNLIAYLLPLGTTSRQLANASLSIKDFLNQIKNAAIEYSHNEKEEFAKKYFKNKIYISAHRFFSIMISTNTEISQYLLQTPNIIASKLITLFYNQFDDIYFDYYAIKDCINIENIDEIEICKVTLKIHILMWFIENIICSVINSKNQVHGRICLIETIKKYYGGNYQLIGTTFSIKQIMCYYEYFLQNIDELYHLDTLNLEQIDNYLYHTKRLYIPVPDQKDEDILGDSYIKRIREDKAWFCSYLKIIYLSFSGLGFIKKDFFIKFVENNFNIKENFNGYKGLIGMDKDFIDILSSVMNIKELEEKAEKFLEEISSDNYSFSINTGNRFLYYYIYFYKIELASKRKNKDLNYNRTLSNFIYEIFENKEKSLNWKDMYLQIKKSYFAINKKDNEEENLKKDILFPIQSVINDIKDIGEEWNNFLRNTRNFLLDDIKLGCDNKIVKNVEKVIHNTKNTKNTIDNIDFITLAGYNRQIKESIFQKSKEYYKKWKTLRISTNITNSTEDGIDFLDYCISDVKNSLNGKWGDYFYIINKSLVLDYIRNTWNEIEDLNGKSSFNPLQLQMEENKITLESVLNLISQLDYWDKINKISIPSYDPIIHNIRCYIEESNIEDCINDMISIIALRFYKELRLYYSIKHNRENIKEYSILHKSNNKNEIIEYYENHFNFMVKSITENKPKENKSEKEVSYQLKDFIQEEVINPLKQEFVERLSQL